MSKVLLNFIKILLVVVHTISAVFGNHHDSRVPETNFNCQDHEFPGYFADPETDCQVFHICVHRLTRYDQYSFLCPNGTAFDQELLVCAWRYNVDCSTTASFYHINRLIYQEHGDSSELFGETSEVTLENSRQQKSLPINSFRKVSPNLVELTIPEESRRPLEILSDISTDAVSLKNKAIKNKKIQSSQRYGKPLDISSRSPYKSNQAQNSDKVDTDKKTDLGRNINLSGLQANGNVVPLDRVPSSSKNMANNNSNSKKKASSLSITKPSRNQGQQKNSQSNNQSTGVTSKLSNNPPILTKSPLITKTGAGVSYPNSKIAITKTSRKFSPSTKNKNEFNRQKATRKENLPSKVSHMKKISDKKINKNSFKPTIPKSQIKLNIPSTVPLPVGLFSNKITPKRPNKLSPVQANIEKAPILIISSAEAETNEQNQKRVYVNRIKSNIEGKPLKIGRNKKKNNINPQKKLSAEAFRGIPSSSKISKKNSRRLKTIPSANVKPNPSTNQILQQKESRQPDKSSFQRTTFRDESLEEGKLGLIASSILKLQPRFF